MPPHIEEPIAAGKKAMEQLVRLKLRVANFAISSRSQELAIIAGRRASVVLSRTQVQLLGKD